MARRIAVAALFLAAGCDTPSPSAPMPTPNPTSANQSPLIAIGAVTPALGITDVTTFTAPVDVRDPDGDPVSLTVTGCSFGTESPVALENGAAILSFEATGACGSSIALTATDARGGLTHAKAAFLATNLNGWFRLVIGEGFYTSPSFAVNLTQTGTVLTGTIVGGSHRGTTDPTEPGTIDAEGRFRLRFKIQSEEEDLIVTGRVLSASRDLFNDVLVASGGVIGRLYGGRTFQLWHEAQY